MSTVLEGLAPLPLSPYPPVPMNPPVVLPIVMAPPAPINEQVPSRLPLDEEGRPIFHFYYKSTDEKKLESASVQLRVLRPIVPLRSQKNQTYIFINGSQASGKTHMSRELKSELLQIRKDRKLIGPNPVVIVDTDVLFQEAWTETITMTDEEQQKSTFLSKIHPILETYFATQPENALIVCCGVSDYVVGLKSKMTKKISEYLVPHLSPTMAQYFIKIDYDTLRRQRFKRDVLMHLVRHEDEYVDLFTEIELPSWNARLVDLDAHTDREVYVNILGYKEMIYDDIIKAVRSSIDLFVARTIFSRSSEVQLYLTENAPEEPVEIVLVEDRKKRRRGR